MPGSHRISILSLIESLSSQQFSDVESLRDEFWECAKQYRPFDDEREPPWILLADWMARRCGLTSQLRDGRWAQLSCDAFELPRLMNSSESAGIAHFFDLVREFRSLAPQEIAVAQLEDHEFSSVSAIQLIPESGVYLISKTPMVEIPEHSSRLHGFFPREDDLFDYAASRLAVDTEAWVWKR